MSKDIIKRVRENMTNAELNWRRIDFMWKWLIAPMWVIIAILWVWILFGGESL